MYVENLEVYNSLKWVLFNIVNGQITSDALPEVRLSTSVENLTAVVIIPIQTLTISQ